MIIILITNMEHVRGKHLALISAKCVQELQFILHRAVISTIVLWETEHIHETCDKHLNMRICGDIGSKYVQICRQSHLVLTQYKLLSISHESQKVWSFLNAMFCLRSTVLECHY